MTFAPDKWKQLNEPLCEKHHFRGFDCPQCHHEKFVTIPREEFDRIMQMLTSMFKNAGLGAGVKATANTVNKYKINP